MKVKVETTNAPQAPAILSQAIVSNGFIFVAGQIHQTPDGKVVNGTIEEKLKQIMNNIQSILKEAGADLDDIVKATVWITDMTQMPDINKLYPTFFTEPLPAREAICVQELPLGATIEISVVAIKE